VLAIYVAVALSVSGAYVVHGAGAPGLPGARPLVQHCAPMASYRTMDLREEINRSTLRLPQKP
jgi:hypothetical protein